MCANYQPPKVESFRYFDRPQPDFSFSESYPGSVAPTLTNFDPQLWVPACFGLVPNWAKTPALARSTYNARSETVAEKPSFRTAWKKRQFCIIPANAIFEPNYESGKPVRWRIERADQKPFGIAGIWERTQKEGLPPWSMTMLTINADEHPLMRRFHKPGDEKRSVVVLDDDDWDQWLDAKNESDIRAMLRLFEPEIMTAKEDPRGAKSANASLDF
jgi:putative SOS response-associated peptidase YedK